MAVLLKIARKKKKGSEKFKPGLLTRIDDAIVDMGSKKRLALSTAAGATVGTMIGSTVPTLLGDNRGTAAALGGALGAAVGGLEGYMTQAYSEPYWDKMREERDERVRKGEPYSYNTFSKHSINPVRHYLPFRWRS